MLSYILLICSAAANAIDMTKPTGTGNLRKTNISIGGEETTIDFRGPVEIYGTVFATHYLKSVDEGRTRETLVGRARAMLNDGRIVVTTPRDFHLKRLFDPNLFHLCNQHGGC